jgi:hypothetical protein
LGALTSRHLIGAVRALGLSSSHVAKHEIRCHSDLQLTPAPGMLVEMIGTIGNAVL